MDANSRKFKITASFYEPDPAPDAAKLFKTFASILGSELSKQHIDCKKIGRVIHGSDGAEIEIVFVSEAKNLKSDIEKVASLSAQAMKDAGIAFIDNDDREESPNRLQSSYVDDGLILVGA